MSDNLENNPFFGLFGSVKDANSFTHQNDDNGSSSNSDNSESKTTQEETRTCEENPRQKAVNALIEDVFCITVSKRVLSQPLILVEETAASIEPSDKLDVNSLEQALFERLLLEEPANHVIKPSTLGNSAVNHHVIEKDVLSYLFECHKQLMDMKRWKPDLEEDISSMDLLVIRNFATALTQPELYGTQRLHIQFLDMFNDYDNAMDHLSSLISSLVDMIISDEGVEAGSCSLARALKPVLDEVKDRAKNSSLLTLNRYHMHLIKYFSSIPVLGDILLQHSTPRDGEGVVYADTLFGAILSTSCLPRTGITYQPSEQFQFDRSMESGFWTGLNFICDSMHTVFFNLFKNSMTSRHALLLWIGKCLHANAKRGKLSNSHENELSAFVALSTVSDGFMMNLGGVLLRLCKPFAGKPLAFAKLLRVDPTYCTVQVQDETEANERWVHMRGMSSETCLISLSGNDDGQPIERPSAPSFNFVTEMFFMTHRALDLGMRVVFGKWMQLNQELVRDQRRLEQTQARSPEAAQTFRQILDSNMTRSFAMRATLLEPGTVSLLGEFFVASAEWLVQVAIQPPRIEGSASYAPLERRNLSFPLPDFVPPTLSCVPEFLVENIACYQSMVRRFAPETLEQNGTDFLVPLLSQVLVFMGCKQRMRNPHLRARLAECLESLLPHSDSVAPGHPAQPSSINRENLFRNHPHRAQIVPCLLDVFVGIEVTGESVAFEQKFNYRRPMYVAMDYLWTLQEQKKVFNELAVYAEANMGAVQPPLFLRFINLLMNDAIFLLDEALDNMALLRNMQNARTNGEWDRLSPTEREQNEGRFTHIGMIARFDNILGKETIHTLQFITTEITSIFCDPTLVDRISSMLNYFLVRLVGPNKKNFKVKDQQDYDFKPADLVLDICKIYINLGKSDEFCLAVSRDGRSYSSNLFNLAEQVLVRIGGGMLIADLMQVASKIAELGVQQNKEEELFADGPEEFYDPLLSTLMTDPVILPSSRTVIDRDTIARHLLSDQTDPFTKAPLTLDQVIPDVELKERIQAWKSERRSQKASASSSQENANEMA